MARDEGDRARYAVIRDRYASELVGASSRLTCGHAAHVALERKSLMVNGRERRFETRSRFRLKSRPVVSDQLAQQEAGAAQTAAETELSAPIDDTVQQLAVHTVGGVVTPAQTLLTVVPDDAPVLIEAMVENDDIGFLHTGQAVEVKVKTFPYTRYGLLHGTVLDVSRDAVHQDGAGEKQRADRASNDDDTDSSDAASRPASGYVAHVALERTSLSVDGHDRKLETGMEVTAEIKTGRRRVISYPLTSLQRYVHDGLGER